MIFKLAILGDRGVGKSTFVYRHMTGEFVRDDSLKDEVCKGCKVRTLTFYTNYGIVTFHCFEAIELLHEAQACLLMFDVCNLSSYNNIGDWHGKLGEMCGQVPVGLCGNKVDVKNRQVKPKMIDYHREHGIAYYDISAKSCYNHEKPFIQLARKLTGYGDLEFVAHPVAEVTEVTEVTGVEVANA